MPLTTGSRLGSYEILGLLGVGGRRARGGAREVYCARDTKLVAQELTLSFVPDTEQRLWRTVRLCRLIWKILHQRIRYEERGPAVSKTSKQARAAKMIRELRSLGYRVELLPSQPGTPA